MIEVKTLVQIHKATLLKTMAKRIELLIGDLKNCCCETVKRVCAKETEDFDEGDWIFCDDCGTKMIYYHGCWRKDDGILDRENAEGKKEDDVPPF